jgi:hypothetical protein
MVGIRVARHVLQEEVHHAEHQHDCFDERPGDLLDRDPHERCRVIGNHGFHAGRVKALQLAQPSIHTFDGVERVRAGGELDRHGGCGLAVEAGAGIVALAAEFDPGDIAQTHLRAARERAQDDVLELVRIAQPRLRADRGIQLLSRRGGERPDLTRGNLRVLRLHRVLHIERRQLELIQLVRIEPDAHRVLRTEHLGVADSLDPADRVGDVARQIIREIPGGHAGVGGNEGEHDQKILHRFRDLQALLLHWLRQQWRREREFVLHLYLCGIGVRAVFEREGDRRLAVRLAGRRDVAQVVEALHLLLDDLRDRVIERLRGGAGVGCGNGDLGRGDARILRDRQVRDRDHAAQHDEDRKDPGENRTLDEET